MALNVGFSEQFGILFSVKPHIPAEIIHSSLLDDRREGWQVGMRCRDECQPWLFPKFRARLGEFKGTQHAIIGRTWRDETPGIDSCH